jgi:hypothetical protein
VLLMKRRRIYIKQMTLKNGTCRIVRDEKQVG